MGESIAKVCEFGKTRSTVRPGRHRACHSAFGRDTNGQTFVAAREHRQLRARIAKIETTQRACGGDANDR